MSINVEAGGCPDWSLFDWSYGPLNIDGSGSSFTPTTGNSATFHAIANSPDPIFSGSANGALLVTYSGIGCTGNAHIVFSATAVPAIPGYGLELRNADTNDLYFSFYQDEHPSGTYDLPVTLPVLGAPVDLVLNISITAEQNQTVDLEVTFS